MKSLMFALIFLISTVTTLQMDPPLWAQHFSQSFEVETSSSNQTGKMWFDYSNQKYRYDFDRPDQRTLCDYFTQYNTPCTHLYSNNKLYFILPQLQICCFLDNPIGSGLPPRDWLKVENYTFTGQVYVDGQYFNRWQRFNYSHVEYLADKSDKMIPKRDARDKIIFDFWLNSYSDEPININVFNVPDYCDKPCSYHQQKQDQVVHRKFGSKTIQELVDAQIHANPENLNQLQTNQQ